MLNLESMTTTADSEIDQELEQAHAQLLAELASRGGAQCLYILTPPPADEPE